MTEDAARLHQLGALVRIRRSALGLDVAPLARQLGMSPNTWARIEDGLPVRLGTFGRVEQALQWRPGAILRYLEGGPEPEPAEPIPIPPPYEEEVVIRVRSPRAKSFAEQFRALVEEMDAEDAEEAARRRAARPDEGPSTAAG